MEILKIIFPIFAIAALGYLVARKQFFKPEEIAGISRFVFNLAIPALLFNALSKIELSDTLDWRYLVAYYGVALAINFTAITIGKRFFGHNQREIAIFGMASSFSNSVLVGLPIISGGFGDQALLPLFTLISVNSAILFSVVTFVAEKDPNNTGFRWEVLRQAGEKIIGNPIVLSLILGLSVNLLNVQVAGILDHILELIAQTALPCALFVLGASLTEYRIAGHLREVFTILGFKVVLMPLLVWIMGHFVFHLDPLWTAVGTMVAGMPVGINPYMFSQKYQALVATIGTAVLLSSLMSIVSASVMLYLFL